MKSSREIVKHPKKCSANINYRSDRVYMRLIYLPLMESIETTQCESYNNIMKPITANISNKVNWVPVESASMQVLDLIRTMPSRFAFKSRFNNERGQLNFGRGGQVGFEQFGLGTIKRIALERKLVEVVNLLIYVIYIIPLTRILPF